MRTGKETTVASEERDRLRVLITAPYFQPVVDDYRDAFERRDIEIVVPEVDERVEEGRLRELIRGVDGALCGDDRFTDSVLEVADRLEVIVKWGTGIDSINEEACERRGVAVRNTEDAFTAPVSDTVMSMVLAFARRTVDVDRSMKAGGWEKLQGRALHECTLGIVGVGNIGTAVARKANAFGMELLGNDVEDVPTDVRTGLSLEPVALEELLRRSDFVSLNCDLNPTSRGLIDDDALSLMKPTAVLVNTARGPILNEAALIEALRSEEGIAGAGLDVFEEEPLSQDSPLRAMNEVLLSPHNANSSPAAWRRVHENSLEQLFRELGR